MSRNIEIKARIESADAWVPKIAVLAEEGPIDIAQDDTFFRCDTARLKLRAFSSDTGELIYYRRADAYGPKESFYLRDDEPTEVGVREARELMEKLDIKPHQLIDEAYVDLLARRGVD